MKKLLSLFICGLLCLSLCSCNFKANEQSNFDSTYDYISSATQTTDALSSNEQSSTQQNPSSNESNPAQSNLSLSSIPAYSGKPYAVLNNNKPNFDSQILNKGAFEQYGALDSLGRCTVALAVCGKEIMPKENEDRGSISGIKPTGWVQAQYDNVQGKYLYNRCHLIGWQLSAENANNRNLITGTRYFNTKGMLPFENMVADYIRETSNHVAYRITPIFSGNNLLASGVQMEAYSIEDDGDGICFNVFVYNVQPDITINYATGKSSGPKVTQSSKPQTSSQNTVVTQPENNDQQTSMVWIPKSGTKYHSNSSCSGMKNPTQVTIFEAKSQNYEPCKKCYK